MSRGLLVHRVRLQPQADGRFDAQCRVADCQVLAPTEWNFHPSGGLGLWLADRPARGSIAGRGGDPGLGLAIAALDPCVPFELVEDGTIHA
jgi:hypothetical protein